MRFSIFNIWKKLVIKNNTISTFEIRITELVLNYPGRWRQEFHRRFWGWVIYFSTSRTISSSDFQRDQLRALLLIFESIIVVSDTRSTTLATKTPGKFVVAIFNDFLCPPFTMSMPAHRAALTRTDYRILGRMTFRWRFSPRTNSGEELFCLVVPQAVREFSCREDYSTDYWLCCAPRMINYWRWSYARGAVLCIVCADDVSWTVGEPIFIITTITDTAHHNLKLWFHQISNYCPFVFVFLFVCVACWAW